MVYNERFGLKISVKFGLRRSEELTGIDTTLNRTVSPTVNIPGQKCKIREKHHCTRKHIYFCDFSGFLLDGVLFHEEFLLPAA